LLGIFSAPECSKSNGSLGSEDKKLGFYETISLHLSGSEDYVKKDF
jgi:hypothetical protein